MELQYDNIAGSAPLTVPAVGCYGLTKTYGASPALSELSVELPAGKIIGLLGPNGSGKTTLIKILAGLLRPTAGDVRICGKTPSEETKAEVSYLPERMYFDPGMKVETPDQAKKRGATTLCITSLAHASAAAPRNPAGLRLHEACDIVLDNGGVPGDAAIEIGPYRCGPTSTVAGAALLQAVVCGVVEALVAEGREPEVFRSANEDGGDEANEAFLRRYRASIPML